MAMILRSVGPARGAQWVRDGVRLYLKRPLAFTALFVLFMCVALFVGLVPVIGGLLQMMLVPMLSLGFMVASQSALLDGPVHPSQFIDPLRGRPAQRRSLIVLCVAYGLLVVGVLLVSDLVADGGFSRAMELMRRPNPPQGEIDALLTERPIVAGTLFGLTLLTGVTVPFWHAPALVHWGSQGPGQALFSSTLAVWRCKGAFFAYSLAWAGVIAVFGTLLGLLFALFGVKQLAGLVAMPAGLMFSTVFYVSLLFTYEGCFSDDTAPQPEARLEAP